mmetsp:Transcript_41407/g.61280  ORF Transcript_41407/g.61280 Transcript_41407/m.61280 type:complete len:92 (-) Transcript_41407:73-348(-)
MYSVPFINRHDVYWKHILQHCRTIHRCANFTLQTPYEPGLSFPSTVHLMKTNITAEARAYTIAINGATRKAMPALGSEKIIKVGGIAEAQR